MSRALTASLAAFPGHNRPARLEKPPSSIPASVVRLAVMEACVIFVSHGNQPVEDGGSSRLQTRQNRNFPARRCFVPALRIDSRRARGRDAAGGDGDRLRSK